MTPKEACNVDLGELRKAHRPASKLALGFGVELTRRQLETYALADCTTAWGAETARRQVEAAKEAGKNSH